MFLRFFYAFIVFLLPLFSTAQELRLIRAIPMHATLMTIDELGNVYIVRKGNSLVRFTETGDSSAFYSTVQNGPIGSADVNNPLRVLLYFPKYSKITLLDRMLAYKNEIDLRKINIYTPEAVASGADGNVWVYDRFNARLLKISEQLETMGESNDLRQQLEEVPYPSYMTERERKVYMCDTAKGIFIFDQYGTYINTLPFYGIKYLQVYGPQLIYTVNDTLHVYNMQSFAERTIELPQRSTPIRNAALLRNVLYVLYEDELVLYRMP